MSLQSLETPLNDHLLVEAIPGDETVDGVIIPGELRDDRGVARVLKISPDLKLNIALDDVDVMYRKGSGVKVTADPEETKSLIRYRDLMMILGSQVPLNDFVLAEAIKEEKGVGGIILSEELRRESGFAKVLGVSPDLKVKSDLKDETIMHRKGTGVKISGSYDETKILIHYSDVMSMV